MWFFDIKIILIAILAVAIYFIYKELKKINFKINTLFNMYKKMNHHQLNENKKVIDMTADNLSTSSKMMDALNGLPTNNKMMDTLTGFHNQDDNIMNIMGTLTGFPTNNQDNNLMNIVETLTGAFPDNIQENNQDLINIMDTLTNGFPDNIITGCIIKTINIPLNNTAPNVINMSPENIKVQTTEETEETTESDVEIIPSETVEKFENNNLPETTEQILQETENTVKSDEKKHIEIYSNENTPIETNTTVEINKVKPSSDDIIKNINKYKLPELQDLAIEYNISIQNNNKKKSKNELIDDIKKYILNKNI